MGFEDNLIAAGAKKYLKKIFWITKYQLRMKMPKIWRTGYAGRKAFSVACHQGLTFGPLSN